MRLAVDLAAHDTSAAGGCELCFTTHDGLYLGQASFANAEGPCDREQATTAVWDDPRITQAHRDHAVACLGEANVERWEEG